MKQNIRIHKAEPNRGVLNYSYLLDAPAGKHGFVKAKKGHLYFEDGTRAKFIGFNISARSNTPDHETAEKMAERFASMGVNILRLHAADAPTGEEPGSWSSCKEAPLLDYESGNSRHFHPEGRERFDYFVAKCKEKGIYFHIDLIVARAFLEGDELDYPGEVASCQKRYPMYNERLIELQKEYAKEFLCHVNPYTGLALIEDPAVVTVQINNEESAIKGAEDGEHTKCYQEEVQRRFNHYLLMKYASRKRLKEAWTSDGMCALKEEEDPEQGTVKGVAGGFYQPVNNPDGSWETDCEPPRYADFMEFGIYMNRKFYRQMKNYLRSLGVRVPIVASNLLAGAADVYGHIDGDLMENNSYFNHPLMPVQGNTYLVAGPMEYVSVNPLTVQKGAGAMATTILGLASVAVVGGKPFILSEWNEYGEHPFHSTALIQTAAYACLNDWDGLILYSHHTSEHWNDQPADEILSVFDSYNDPAVICQWGFAATMFLKGLAATARNRVDLVYTPDDLLTLPDFHMMPMMFFPYITAMRNVFLEGDSYQGEAEVAVHAGFFNGADLADAKHGIYYAWSSYRDAMRRNLEKNRLVLAAKGSRETAPGIHLGEQALVFDEISRLAGEGDYRGFAEWVTQAMKEWKLLPKGSGYTDGTFVSDTKEIEFDPDHSVFQVKTPYCACFSGKPKETIVLSDRIWAEVRNERISLTLLPIKREVPLGSMIPIGSEVPLESLIPIEDIVPDKEVPQPEGMSSSENILLDEAEEFLLTAMGTTGMDKTTMNPGPELMGISFTAVTFQGKLYAETWEGSLHVKAKEACLQVLNPVGEVLQELSGEAKGEEICFELDGTAAGVQYYLNIRR